MNLPGTAGPQSAAGADGSPQPGAGGSEAAACLEAIRQFLLRVDPKAVSKLVPMLSHRDAGVRREAAQALQVYGWSPSSDEERAARALARQEYEQVIALGAAAVGPLGVMLQDPVAGNRLAALEMMLSLSPRPPLEELAPAWKDPEPALRLVAIQALAQTTGAAALEVLGQMLEDSAQDVRAAAFEALSRKPGPETVPLMLRALADPAPDLRWHAAEWLTGAAPPPPFAQLPFPRIPLHSLRDAYLPVAGEGLKVLDRLGL